MSTPHDALFKLVFQRPEYARDQLRHVLPDSLSRELTWSTLRLLDPGRVDAGLLRHHADLVFAVDLKRCDRVLYILFEHKSGPDRYAALQLLRYAVRELEVWHAENPHAPLPYVAAVLLHHDVTPWSSGTQLIDMCGRRPPPDLAKYVLNFRFLLDDLAVEGAADLRSRNLPALARLALFCLKRARHAGDFLAELQPWIQDLRQVPWATSTQVTHQGLLLYIMQVTDVTYAAFDEFLRVHVGPEAEESMKTAYDKILEEGEAKGVAKGMATILLAQLQKRFGPLSEDTVQRVHRATTGQLELWATRVLTEDTPDRVLALD